MIINRVWAMPSLDTFDCKPIGDLVRKYLNHSVMSIDPFARNKDWAKITNDLNPKTTAQYHLEARAFLRQLLNDDCRPDLVILDPPYSQVQVARAYKGVGREYKPFGDDNNAVLYREVRDLVNQILRPNGIVISFGWNSAGMGKKRGYEILEVLLVCHGAAHNDTIGVVERNSKGV